MTRGGVWEHLSRAIAAIGTGSHIDRLIDLIGADVPHDTVTVTRYSATRKPEFVTHRGFSHEMVRRYLDDYYVYDPFYASWRRHRQPGVTPLQQLADDALRRGRYIAEFLAQSAIRDEVGVVLADGGDWGLGIFLDRSRRLFRASEIGTLERRFATFAALHAQDVKTRAPGFMRTRAPSGPAAAPRELPTLPGGLWPELSERERELVELILRGHPSATIAGRLGITVGTVKNHRHRIYEKLDITTERELFLRFLDEAVGAQPRPIEATA